MIPRVLEPEVMDTPEEASDYDAMDHAEVNRVFVDDLLAAMEAALRSAKAARREPRPPEMSRPPVRVLDVGTGTALIPVELCRRAGFGGEVVAVDLAGEMLQLARRRVAEAGVSERVHVELADAKALPFDDGAFGVVMSNSIVHHIPEPADVLREMLRVLKPGGLLFVRDLLRPNSEADVEQIVADYAASEPAHAQQLFRQSLRAALTVDEMQQLAVRIGLPGECVRQTSDRHWTLVFGGG